MSIFIRIGVLFTMFFTCFYPLQADEGEKPCGIINLSVATLCEKPDFSSEMMTQALLGMPVRVLEQGDWHRIQTPDDYVAWVHRAGVCLTTPEELKAGGGYLALRLCVFAA